MALQPLQAKNFLELKNKFKAWVQVDHTRLDCHAIDIPNKRSREASCWIPSQENKTFEVKFRKLRPTKANYLLSLYLDGKKVDDCILYKNETRNTTTFRGLSTKEGLRHFQFSPLRLTDEEEFRDLLIRDPDAAKIGEITLRLQRIIHVKTRPHKKGDPSDGEDENGMNFIKEAIAREPQKVHESCHKAQSVPHQISFGEPIPQETSRPSLAVEKEKDEDDCGLMTWYTLPGEEEKLQPDVASFTFRYRPLRILATNGIVPVRFLSADQLAEFGLTVIHQVLSEDEAADDAEFRGSPPPNFDSNAPRRASSRRPSALAAGNSNNGRINYADYDTAEEENPDDDSDMYVRSEDERATVESPVSVSVPLPISNATPTVAAAAATATDSPSDAANEPVQTMSRGPTPNPVAQPSPTIIIREQSEERNHALVGPNTVSNGGALPKPTHLPSPATSATIDPLDAQSHRIKLEEIEMGMPQTIIESQSIPDAISAEHVLDESGRSIEIEHIELTSVPPTAAAPGAENNHCDELPRTSSQPPVHTAEQQGAVDKSEEEMKPSVSDYEEDEEERTARLNLEAIRERKRAARDLERAAKRVKIEEETRTYFQPGEVIDLVSD